MTITHTNGSWSTECVLCITVIFTIIHLTDTEPRRQHHQNINSPWDKSNNTKKIRQTNCAQASLQQRGLNERAFGSTHLAPGRAVGLSLSPWLCCVIIREREGERLELRHQRALERRRERASADWSLCGWWEWLGGGRDYLPLAAGVADGIEWDKSDGDAVSARCV